MAATRVKWDRCVCGATMLLKRSSGGTLFWACDGCRKARPFRASTRWRRAARILAKTSGANIGKLVAEFGRAPAKIEPLIVGDETPTGRPTLEARLRRRKLKGEPRRAPFEPAEWGPDIGLYRVEVDAGCSVAPASRYPHHKIFFDELNPVQTAVLPFVDLDVNLVVAAATSAGKTVVAEMEMGAALARGWTAVFLSPLRAVSREKYDDWTHPSHAWSERRVEIATGDFTGDDDEEISAKLERAEVIVMTSEMLDSRSRRAGKKKRSRGRWINRVGTLVVDEAHLITMEGRGDALEAGLMRFSLVNPASRIVLLSATMPNVDELATWLTRLNGKPSVIVDSTWRPTKLTVHWVPYNDRGDYHTREDSKRSVALRLMRRYADDKFIVFVHSKRAGRDLVDECRDFLGEKVDFHSSDLSRDQRIRLERRFKGKGLRIVIATSTLAYGINMPARRVIVLGIHRGLEQVDPIDVHQECGRAGRRGLDPEGDAYVLIPETRRIQTHAEYSKIPEIRSTMNDLATLAFHLTAEVADGGVRTVEDALKWHDRSFAFHQGQPLVDSGDEVSAANVMDQLVKFGILKVDERGRHEATMLGRVSSWLYYSPFDVAGWAENFRELYRADALRDSAAVAWALGSVRSYFDEWCPREAEMNLGDLTMKVRAKVQPKTRLPVMSLAFYELLMDVKRSAIQSQQRQAHHEAPRLSQALALIDRHVLKCLGSDYLDMLRARLIYRCSWKEAELCSLPGVGKKRATQLVRQGLSTLHDVAGDKQAVVEVLGKKIGTAAWEAAVRRTED